MEDLIAHLALDPQAQAIGGRIGKVMTSFAPLLHHLFSRGVIVADSQPCRVMCTIPSTGNATLCNLRDDVNLMEDASAHERLERHAAAVEFKKDVHSLQSQASVLDHSSSYPLLRIHAAIQDRRGQPDMEFQTSLFQSMPATCESDIESQIPALMWRLGLLLAARPEPGEILSAFRIGSRRSVPAHSPAKAALVDAAFHGSTINEAAEILRTSGNDIWAIQPQADARALLEHRLSAP